MPVLPGFLEPTPGTGLPASLPCTPPLTSYTMIELSLDRGALRGLEQEGERGTSLGAGQQKD